jgi:formylglycine-generating enzyme required for sulfatase activity
MRLISSGEFAFGSDPNDPDRQALIEKPFARVSLSSFCIDTYEYPNAKGQQPQTNVSYQEAKQLCQQKGKRLCSDQEWERACKGAAANQNMAFSYGQTFVDNQCHVQMTEPGMEPLSSPVPSGTKAECKTAEGVMDMSGNVMEWTSTQGHLNSSAYISKGGSYSSGAYASRCSSLQEWPPETKSQAMGLRCCKSL